MLHCMINEQGKCFDVRDAISEKHKYFYMFSSKSVVSGALILQIIFIADYQAHGPLIQMLWINFFLYFVIVIMLKYR